MTASSTKTRIVSRKVSVLQLVDSLAEITRHHDRNLLERSLLTTLSEVSTKNDIRFYKVASLDDEIELILSAQYLNGVFLSEKELHKRAVDFDLASAISEAIDTGEMVATQVDNDNLISHVYPVFDSENEIYSLLIDISEPPTLESHRLTHGLLRVYSNYMSLLDLSQKDRLTGLLNKECLQQEITKSLMRNHASAKNFTDEGRRSGDEYSTWVGVIDIDHFKKINDRYGHLMGDEILLLFAQIMRSVFRDDDALYRFGGEEFVSVIKVKKPEHALLAFERFRTVLEKNEFPRIGHITASIGVTELKVQSNSNIVINTADRALYFAKEHGRNQTCIYENLVKEGHLQAVTEDIELGEIDLF